MSAKRERRERMGIQKVWFHSDDLEDGEWGIRLADIPPAIREVLEGKIIQIHKDERDWMDFVIDKDGCHHTKITKIATLEIEYIPKEEADHAEE
jgi:hypothetical protein